MNNVSQFKKALQVGKTINTIFHQEFAGRDENRNVVYRSVERPPREISIVQSNSFACKTTKTDGEVVDSWCAYPKASESTFEDGKLTIWYEDKERGEKPIKVLTYWFE
jgi:hypothetical protein